MIDSHSSRFWGRVLGLMAATAMLGGAAVAEDSMPAKKGVLPGVTSDYRIAKTAPLPEPDDAAPTGNTGRFKVGDTDVRISGSITIDVGAGVAQPRR